MSEKRSETISKESRVSSPETVVYTYTLIDPRTKEIRYIGVSNSPKHRLLQHISEAKAERKSAKHIWILSLLRRNLKPTMKVVFSGSREEALAMEKLLIKNKRFNLLNQEDTLHGRLYTKPVYQYDLEGNFLNMFINTTQAELYTKVHNSAILRCCKKLYGNKSAGGYQWSYKKVENIDKLKKQSPAKPVAIVGGKVFKSAREASKETGVCYKRISACLNGRQKTAGGYQWVWYTRYSPASNES